MVGGSFPPWVPCSFLPRGLPRWTARWRSSRQESTCHRWWGSCPATESESSQQLGPAALRSSACGVVCRCAGLAFLARASRFPMPPTRDPFQQPVLNNDDASLGKPRAPKILQYKNPAHLDQQREPWNRLNSIPTITSIRRNSYFFESEIPKDSLDFRLAVLYNHHTGAFKNKSEALIHPETSKDAHGIINIQSPGEHMPPAPPLPITSRANIRQWISPKRESIHSIHGSIVSPHTAATNGGYSRKTDGGFFST